MDNTSFVSPPQPTVPKFWLRFLIFVAIALFLTIAGMSVDHKKDTEQIELPESEATSLSFPAIIETLTPTPIEQDQETISYLP